MVTRRTGYLVTYLKFGEMVVSNGVSVQTATTAPHSFSRPAETCRGTKHHHRIPLTVPANQRQLSNSEKTTLGRSRHTLISYSVQAIGVKGFTSQSQDPRLGVVVTSQRVCWTDMFSTVSSPLKQSITFKLRQNHFSLDI